MIKITIEHTVAEYYTEMQNFVMKRTPTEITEEENNYSGRNTRKVQYIEENEPREVTKTRNVQTTLLEQEIRDDEAFNLAAVIKAINNL